MMAVIVIMVVVMIMIVVMIVVVFVRRRGIRLDVEDAVEVEGIAAEHLVDVDLARARCDAARIRVDAADARLDLAQFGRR